MFKNLQAGYTVHVLDRSSQKPAYYQGTVTNVSKPHYAPNPQLGQFPTTMVVDVSVEYGGKSDTFTVDECATYNAGATISLSCEPMAIANEVQALKKQRDDAIAAMPILQEASEACDDILKALLPQHREASVQNERLDRMERALVAILERMEQSQPSPSPKKAKEQ